jgi:phage baseplate assembly protein W
MGSAMRRPYSSRFNSRVNTLLFEPASEDTAHSLKELVTEIINKGEPRIQLIDTVVNYIEESNAFRIVVVFNMINTKEPVALDFLLYRAR